jgi:hypothetical protein
MADDLPANELTSRQPTVEDLQNAASNRRRFSHQKYPRSVPAKSLRKSQNDFRPVSLVRKNFQQDGMRHAAVHE